MDEEEAGVVGPGRPSVKAMTTSPRATSADQPRDAAGIDHIREPTYDYGSPSDDTVTEHRAARKPTLVSCSGPGVSSDVGQVPTLISGTPGVSVGEGIASAPISGKVGTLYDKENVLPRVHMSLSQFDNAGDEYIYDEYAICSDMLHDRNVNMLHRVVPRYAVPCGQGASP